MATPTPAIPTFTDGTIVHATDLNALSSNLTNLYNYNQASFTSQRPCVIAKTTVSRTLTTSVDALTTFDTALVNTDNMWTASVPTQITIQHAGIYWVFAQARWPTIGAPTLTTGVSCSILVNGTSVTNAIATQLIPFLNTGSGPTTTAGAIVNLAVGATVYLDIWHSAGATVNMPVNFGSNYLGAIFLTSST